MTLNAKKKFYGFFGNFGMTTKHIIPTACFNLVMCFCLFAASALELQQECLTCHEVMPVTQIPKHYRVYHKFVN